MGLLDYILGLVLTAVIMVIIHNTEINSFENQAASIMIGDTASEQVQFGKAVGEYLQTSSLTEGATITVDTLKTVGLLPGGFPETNPFGQTPLAYVGNNDTAVATYTGLPTESVMSAIGYNTRSALSMGGLMEKIILQASADQQTVAYMLVAVQVENGIASSPFTGRSVTLSNYFTGFPTPATPIFGELVNMDTQYSGAASE